jgi:4a-hydroxytetrahydrobiopterin dehydratase
METALQFSSLQNAQCVPLRGPEHLLSEQLVRQALRELPGWELRGAAESAELVREFRFADYYRSIAFVNALAFIAHAQDHHPDLSVHYNRVQVRFSTHDVGGISRNDLICAAKVSALVAV